MGSRRVLNPNSASFQAPASSQCRKAPKAPVFSQPRKLLSASLQQPHVFLGVYFAFQIDFVAV